MLVNGIQCKSISLTWMYTDGRNGRVNSAFLTFPLIYEQMCVLLEMGLVTLLCLKLDHSTLTTWGHVNYSVSFLPSARLSALQTVCVNQSLDGQSVPPYGVLYTAWWTLIPIYEHLPVHLSVTAYFIQPTAMQCKSLTWWWTRCGSDSCYVLCLLIYVIIITRVYIHDKCRCAMLIFLFDITLYLVLFFYDYDVQC